MKGRKPIPSKIKALRGNPGKRPLGKEPDMPKALPECPPHLSDEAKREWNRITADLGATGILSKVDRAALAGYCQAWSRWVEAETALKKAGPVVQTKNGNPIQNPYLAVANKALEQMHKLLTEFGMTPSSRVRLAVPEAKQDRLEAFLSVQKRTAG